ncbi:MAG: bifunctional metallophosphatase/5'-nucleotidase [Candidatus Andeanibacterium colombiense]|uniref:Bifunctional metallophosphatase/5'-nucleotidase n=1 Tax=Candidatus Andeanibacterium colombiense TaxID=3121345 RepID=A0AAJ6BLD1_9SPHN|nr:MAG: bifunctional metallophosphatase/5'-nucleotidase [Sphingomonadaceae bacterium]
MMKRALFGFALSFTLAGCATNYDHGTLTLREKPPEPGGAAAPVIVGIVALNDFHGALEPPRATVTAPDGKGGSVAVPAGGAAWLASAVDSLRAKYPNNVTVAAGDLISASQLSSSIYLDEPAIGVLNRLGLEFSAVGNHEFDGGVDELLRKQSGGCAKYTTRQPCQIEQFGGARFHYLAASTHRADGSTIFPATGLKSFGSGAAKVTVGFIGLTLKDTPNIVSPDGVAGVTFSDEADTINALVPQLEQEGADAIVVLIHQGGKTSSAQPDPNGCADFTGDIQPILARLDPRVDVVVSGHTHWAYICDYGAVDPRRPFLLTSAGVYGELVTDIALEIDPRTHRVIGKHAHNVIVQSDAYPSSRGPVANNDLFPRFEPRTDIAAYVKTYTDAAKVFSGRIVGAVDRAAAKPGAQNAATGGPLGNLVADSQLAATRSAGAEIAFTNPFSLRAPLDPPPGGSLTYDAIYKVEPFANTLITLSMTGAEIKAVLEQGFDDEDPQQSLSPSAGFIYRFDTSRPVGERVVGITLAGKPLDPARTYRVTVNSFLAAGGDGFTVFAPQKDATKGGIDLDALEAWVKGTAPRAVPQEERAIDARPPA